jgi:arsenite methyltransferase
MGPLSMTAAPCYNVFELISDQPFASSGIRPGGVELTTRAVVLSKLPRGVRVLDVGCGTGVTTRLLRTEFEMDAFGIDASRLLVARAKAKESTPAVLMGDARLLPFSDEAFDGLFLECTLSLVQEYAQVIRECRRVLRPLGRLIVTDLYARNTSGIEDLRRLPFHSCLSGALDSDRFVDECYRTGFGLVCFEDHSRLLRDFAARMIWTYGSLERFWTEAGGSGVDPGQIQYAIRKAKPGYFLFVGTKSQELLG